MNPLPRRGLLVMAIAGLGLALAPAPASACPFCGPLSKPTLIEDFNSATMVLFGKFTNQKLDGKDEFSGGTSDLEIDAVLKSHDILGKKKVLTLQRYIPKSTSKYLVFCDVYKGKVEPFRGVEVQSKDIVTYLRGARTLKDKSVKARLAYCFDYLDNAEYEISMDAYAEFAKADYKDYSDLAQKLPPDKVASWLTNPKTPTYRYGLYASLLGHCGKAKHAKLMRGLLDDPEKRISGVGLDGMLVSYTMLDKTAGWKYLRGILKNPKEDFQRRYAALRTIRFFWDTRSDIVKKKELVAGLSLLLDHTDVADFAIEDLRKWKVWSAADRIFALTKKESHQVPVIRRAILRYALSCPKRIKAANEFVKLERKKDKENVDDVEELLKLESEPPAKKPK